MSSHIRRGIGWIAAVLFVLPTIALLLLLFLWHLHYRALLASIAAITPRAGVVRPVPTPQPALIAEYCALIETRPEPFPDLIHVSKDPAILAWLDGGPGPIPVALADDLARQGKRLDGLHDLLARGLHWGHPLTLTPGNFTRVETPDPYAVRAVAERLRLRAHAADDPRQALADLTTFQASLLPPNSLTAYDSVLHIGHERDQAFLTAMLSGDCPADLGRDWRDHAVDPFAYLLSAVEMERCFAVPDMTAGTLAIDPWTFDRKYVDTLDQTLWDKLPIWWRQPEDLRMYEQAADQMEDFFLAGGPPMGAWSWANRTMDFRGYARQALKAANDHRLAVLAAQVIAICDRTGALPADATALDLAAGMNRLQLVYQVLGQRRFSIGIAPTSPLPCYVVGPHYRNPVASHTPSAGRIHFIAGTLLVDASPP